MASTKAFSVIASLLFYLKGYLRQSGSILVDAMTQLLAVVAPRNMHAAVQAVTGAVRTVMVEAERFIAYLWRYLQSLKPPKPDTTVLLPVAVSPAPSITSHVYLSSENAKSITATREPALQAPPRDQIDYLQRAFGLEKPTRHDRISTHFFEVKADGTRTAHNPQSGH